MAKAIGTNNVLPKEEVVAAEVEVTAEEVVDYGTVITPFNELVTTVQPTAETAGETEEE